MNFKNPEGQVARWIQFLSVFHMDIERRPGRRHGNADGVSRTPCRQCGKHEDEDNDQNLYQAGHVISSENVEVSSLKEAQDNERDVILVKQ